MSFTSVDKFLELQRQRLQQIRTATHREQTALAATEGSVLRQQSQPAPIVNESETRTYPSQGTPSSPIHAENNDTLVAAEIDVDQRLDRANERKRSLLVKLSALQVREAALQDEEQVLLKLAKELDEQEKQLHERQREVQFQRGAVASDVAQREVTLHAARRKFEEKFTEDQRQLARQRNQVAAIEERNRELESALQAKRGRNEDTLRELSRMEYSLRDEELSFIATIRREIELREYSMRHKEQ